MTIDSIPLIQFYVFIAYTEFNGGIYYLICIEKCVQKML